MLAIWTASYFIKFFWDEMKFDLEELLDVFHVGKLDTERLNHGIFSRSNEWSNWSYFSTSKGAKQVDPLYPLLLDIIVDELAMMVKES